MKGKTSKWVDIFCLFLVCRCKWRGLMMMMEMMVVKKASKFSSPAWKAGPIWSPKWRSWWWWRSVSRKTPCLWQGRFLGYIRRYAKGGGEATFDGQTGLGVAVPLGRATCALLGPRWPQVHIFSPNSLFFIKTSVVFFPEFISNVSCVRRRKEDFC